MSDPLSKVYEDFSKKVAGKPYRPANGTEGHEFQARWCDRCKHDEAFRAGAGDSCPIIANSMVFGAGDPEYPAELAYDDRGDPKCTAFEAVGDE